MIKAKLEVVEAGITTIDDEFLAHILVPGTDQTVDDRVRTESPGRTRCAATARCRARTRTNHEGSRSVIGLSATRNPHGTRSGRIWWLGFLRTHTSDMGSNSARLGRIFVAATIGSLLIAGCGSSDQSGSSDTQKFVQTWPTGYGSTTCRQWLNEMTSAQRFAAAADMLVGARSTDKKSAGLPSDSLINSFAGDVSQGCEPIPSMTIGDAAVSIYLLGRAQYQP